MLSIHCILITSPPATGVEWASSLKDKSSMQPLAATTVMLPDASSVTSAVLAALLPWQGVPASCGAHVQSLRLHLLCTVHTMTSCHDAPLFDVYAATASALGLPGSHL